MESRASGPVSMRKEIGLPDARVTRGSVLLIMEGPCVVPWRCQSSPANPRRSGSLKPGVRSEWITDMPLPGEAWGQSYFQWPSSLHRGHGPGGA